MKKMILLAVTIGFSAAISASAAGAKENYDHLCAKCHGQDGKGKTRIGERIGAQDFTDAKVQAAMTDESAFNAMKKGFKNKQGRRVMKPFTELSDSDIKALVKYVRAFKK